MLLIMKKVAPVVEKINKIWPILEKLMLIALIFILNQLMNHTQTQTLPKVFWNNGKMVSNTPFSIVENRRLDCQFGHHYYKEKPQKSSRVRIQPDSSGMIASRVGCVSECEHSTCLLEDVGRSLV